MDAPTPPAIVFDAQSVCADAKAAERVLHRSLASSLAPRSGWSVHVGVSHDVGALRAVGEIIDDRDVSIAYRAISRSSYDCGPLVQAMGVWATLVLDVELTRASEPEIAPTVAANANVPASRSAPSPVFVDASETEARPIAKKSIEVGSTAFFESGTGGGAIAGSSLYADIELEDAWILRPAAQIGRSLGAADDASTQATARVEMCKRVSGPYAYRRGIQFDACGQGEFGFFSVPGAPALPLLAVGPSASLHGELGDDVAIELRGGAALNAARASTEAARPALIASRIELGFSWKIR